MSASKQKRLRSNSDAVDKKVLAAQEKAAKDKKYRRNAVIFIVIFAILVAVAVFINSNFFATSPAAVVVNGNKYNATELSFYYSTAYNQFVQQYGDYVMYLIDTSKPLSEQECSLTEGGTWADYFTEQALALLEEADVLYNKAIAEGYTIDDEISQLAESNLAYLSAAAMAQGHSDIDTYLSLAYCKAMDSEAYIDVISKYLLATKYSGDNFNSYEYTEEQLDTFYTENADKYDTYTFNLYYVLSSNEAYKDYATDEEKLAAAKADAEKIAAAATEEEFNAAAAQLATSETVDTRTTAIGQSLPEVYASWVKDASRTEGDTFCVESTSGVYAIRFISREDCNYNTVDVRHILIKAATDEGTTSAADALGKAKAELEAIYEEWQANPTEENFIALANKYSEDTAEDGLYEQVFKYQMVEEFNDFCFDEARQPGDTAIVYGSNGQYEGYHLIYFVGENDLYSRIIADNMLRSEDYSEFLESATANCSSELKWASRFAGLD